jgi:hypothetical protein
LKKNKPWEDNKNSVMSLLRKLLKAELSVARKNIKDTYLLEVAAFNIHNLAIILSYMDSDNFKAARKMAEKDLLVIDGLAAILK